MQAAPACDYCHTPIEEQSTMVQQRGETFCCPNCAVAGTGATPSDGSTETCMHCGVAILDRSTEIDRGGQMFCCLNCAMAMSHEQDQPHDVGQHPAGGRM